ncbi:suppressor of fused domain protein [Chryseolinea soli]|uniref:Suppressor of fused domain protein n=1 Tax=Chryseolinea soli TaxID=2321403 RepID=A0A385SUY1_9BACT|nr:suppressor of fused domain protein [Chryseolinea soli]AYB34111.1 suppressor of fused domain protein [Chryseolinea soli]
MDFREKEQFIDHYELVDKHIDTYFKGADIHVFHEIPTLDIHLDVYHIRPENAPFELLLTSGMSSISMNVSEIAKNSDAYRFAELMTLIPKGVDFGKMYPSNTKYDWIMSMIKQSAKFPHFYDTWIGTGHSIQAEENMDPYSKDTKYCGCLVLPTMTFPEDFQKIESPYGVINIYGLFPLYKEELEFKIQNGYNEFIQFLIKNNTEEIIDFNRVNYCKKDSGFDKLKRWTKGRS